MKRSEKNKRPHRDISIEGKENKRIRRKARVHVVGSHEKRKVSEIIKRAFKPTLWTLGIITVLAVLIVTVTNITVMVKGNDILEEHSGESYDCILVLGAGLRSDGTPSDMLADRLLVAIELYKDGVSDKLVLSGDHTESRNYDEVSAMETFCIDNGVPAESIVKDGKGYSTYETMLNLKNMGEYRNVVVVTQKYHLYRALFIAEEMELSAVGADAATRTYRGQIVRDVREVAARSKDYFQVKIFT